MERKLTAESSKLRSIVVKIKLFYLDQRLNLASIDLAKCLLQN